MTTYKINIDGNLYAIANSNELAISLQTQDVRDLNELRKRTVSKTLQIYGNEETNKLFASIWDIRYTSDGNMPATFNHLNRKECELYEDDIKIFDGAVILKRVQIVRNVIVYEFIFVIIELKKFSELDKLTLKQLTAFEKYNHTLNHTNVYDSWDGYCYVNGIRTNLFSGNRPNGVGYLYPIGFYGNLTKTSNTTEELTITDKHNSNKLIPAFYVREILSEIFNTLGITADFSSIDGDMFKSLLISGDYGQYKRQIEGITHTYLATVALNPYSRYLTDVFVYNGSTSVATFIDNCLIISDNITQDDTSSIQASHFIVAKTGTLRVELTAEADITHNWLNNVKSEISLKINKNGVNAASATQQTTATNTTAHTAEFSKFIEIQVNAGDVIDLEFCYTLTTYYNNITAFQFDLVDFDLAYKQVTKSYGYGDTVAVTDWLPNMKANEFVNGLIKLFNLYIAELTDNTIKFKTYDDYYYDWATQIRLDEYIDYEDAMEIVPAPIETNIKGLTLRYAQPNDYLNELYRLKTGKSWGERNVVLDTDIATETKEVTMPFSLIVPNQIENVGLFIIPTIYNYKNNKFESVEFKPMLFFFNNSFLSKNVYLYDYDKGTSSWVNSSKNKLPFVSNNYYNITTNDKLNLSFSFPEFLFYDNSTLLIETNVTIYDKFFEYDFNDLINIDAKILKCSINPSCLKQTDLLQRMYSIDGILFRCNKIIDYNKNMRSVKIELIKKLNLTRIKAHVKPIYIPSLADLDVTSYLKSTNYDYDSGTTGIKANELFVDATKKILGIGAYPLIAGARYELFGKISQSGTNNPTITEIVKSVNISFERIGEGVYRTTTTGNYFCIILKNNKTQALDYYLLNSYIYIETGSTDGILNNNYIYILKLN